MNKNQRLDRVPFLVAGAFALILGLFFSVEPIHSIENKWIDQMFRWRGMQSADSRITIVAIDDDSIRKIGQYPWPRGIYSKLLDQLFADGVKVVGFDILFIDPSNSPAEDKALVQATAKWSKRVIYAMDVDFNVRTHYEFRFPFSSLRAAAKYFGVVNQLLIDLDGVVRRTYLMYGTDIDQEHQWKSDPKRKPSLGLQMLAVFENKSPDDYVRDRNKFRLNFLGQEERDVTVRDSDGNSVRGVEPVYGIRRISAIKILNKKLDAAEVHALDGGIVLVGATAIATFDHYPTPFTDQSPGVEVHATVIDNILNHTELQAIHGWETLIIIFVFAVFSAWTLSFTPLVSTFLACGMLATWISVNLYAFHRYWLLQFTAPAMALVGPFLVLLVRRTLIEHEEKRYIKQTFGQFVAPEVVEDLTKNPDRVKKMMEGEKREMSVLFLDIANFTTISETMDPQALIKFLNSYLSGLSDVVHSNKGVVDKYIGDCIMAFWNAPLEQKDHRKLACLAAVECQEAMQALNLKLDGTLSEKPAIRVGVNAGFMTVGLTGSQQKLQYTVIGDEVNLASRLEGANKFFGSRILVSESCYAGAKDAVEARELGRVRVVGKAVPVRVYELLGRKGSLSDAWKRALPSYQAGLKAFNAREFTKAKAEFAAALHILPGDSPSKLYLKKSGDYASALPDSWDGVFNLTEK